MTTRDALRLLQAEIVQVVGCTEPAAIAYALRTLVRHTQPPPSPETFRAELRISVDARRNASTAVVPRLKQPGIHAAAAAGLASRADDFNVFSDFDLPLARAFLKKENWLTIIPVRRRGRGQGPGCVPLLTHPGGPTPGPGSRSSPPLPQGRRQHPRQDPEDRSSQERPAAARCAPHPWPHPG